MTLDKEFPIISVNELLEISTVWVFIAETPTPQVVDGTSPIEEMSPGEGAIKPERITPEILTR